MTKTTALTSTRSLDEIAAEFAEISDKGTLRLSQARLTYEWVGSTEGKDAADLRNSFRLSTNAAVARPTRSQWSPGKKRLGLGWNTRG